MQKQILKKLREIKPSNQDKDIVSLGLVSKIITKDSNVVFSITVIEGQEKEFAYIRDQAEQMVAKLDGVNRVLVSLTSQIKRTATSKNTNRLSNKKERKLGSDMRPKAGVIEGVKSIVAVASGKGGVGKSTSAVNIALSLHALGQKVGLLDADIYGPSIPRLMGAVERPEIRNDKIIPLEKYGIKIMSMGFLMEEDKPVIWRGPMVVSALMQMVREVEWGELDVLVLDMPPGTGDAQLTMAQQVPIDGAVIISTPQDLALIDARKGLKMFNSVDVPIMGIVENMSYFICPKCGENAEIFGHGGAKDEAIKLGVPFLGAIPLHMDIRHYSDEGKPIIVADPKSEHAKPYSKIALKIATMLNKES